MLKEDLEELKKIVKKSKRSTEFEKSFANITLDENNK